MTVTEMWGQDCAAGASAHDSPLCDKAAARALAAAAQAGLELVDDDGVVIQSKTGAIEAATPQATAILGLTTDQALGRDPSDPRWAAIGADGKALRAQDHPSMQAITSGKPTRGGIVGIHRPGCDPAGEHVWLTVDAIPIDDPESPGSVVVRFSFVKEPKATELRLAASERLYRFLVEHDPDMVAWQLPDTTFLWVSSASRTLLGREPASMVGTQALELMHPDDIEAVMHTRDWAIADRVRFSKSVLRMRHQDGSYRWMETAGHLIIDADGQPSQVRTSWRDVTERVEAEQERDAALQMVRSTIESSPIGIAVCREDGSFVQVNHALGAMLGRDSDALVGSTLRKFAHPDDRRVDAFAAVAADDVAIHESECRYRRADGSWMWGHCNLVRVVDKNNRGPTTVLLYLRDVTERRNTSDRLAHAASHDELTGLPNRTALNEHLAKFARQAPTTSAMVFIDLDDFKIVNDTYGHEAGDRLLAEVANRIRGAIRRKDFAARLGGDEFVVHCAGLNEMREAARFVAARILDALILTPYVVGSEKVRLSASIGVATVKQGDTTQLVEHADRAMYRAKQQGRGRIEVEFHDRADGDSPVSSQQRGLQASI